MTRIHTAILLAAGSSRRLQALTADRPKCLLDVGGKPLLGHQIAALHKAGIDRIVVVTGYQAARLEAFGGSELTYVHNEVYDRTNSLYSLSLAESHARAGFVLMNADVLFHPRLLEGLLDSPAPDALLYEPTRVAGEGLGEEEMKVRVEGGHVAAIAKDLPAGGYHGENLGVLKFSATGAAQLFRHVEALVAEQAVNAWAPKAYDRMIQVHPIAAVPTRGLPWIEIDFPEDLDRARTVVWPKIARDLGDARDAVHPRSLGEELGV